MKREQVALLMTKGAISELSAEGQAKVFEAAEKLRAIRTTYGDEGDIALSLVAMEMAAEPD